MSLSTLSPDSEARNLDRQDVISTDDVDLTGPTFWDQPVLTFLGIENVPQVAKYVPNKGLNEAFMWFGALGLLFNIITRCAQRHDGVDSR